MTRIDGIEPKTLDVSHLPNHAWDHRAPQWWGNLLLTFIETTTVMLVTVAYFYIRRNFDDWPPPTRDSFPVLYHAGPGLFWGTLNLAILVASCAIMYWTDMQARKLARGRVMLGLLIMLLIAGFCSWVRFQEFPAIHFRWDDNAYASIVWTYLGLHLSYILIGGFEFLIMLVWILFRGVDESRGLDVTLSGGYWYWVAGTCAVMYAVVYMGPHYL